MEHGSLELLTRLLEEHGSRLVLYARQWCRMPEDVVQEAFVKLMAEPRPPSHPAAWLYRVVRNVAIAAARSEGRRARREAAAARSDWFYPSTTDAIDARTVAAALRELPVELREVIVLRLWSGMSLEQIAELAETSLSTAHRRYHEGLSRLRNRLNSTSAVQEDRTHE